MEFGFENSPVQEIANDLNVGAAHWDRKSHGPTCDGWALAHTIIWRRFMCALTRTPSMILHMSQLSSDVITASYMLVTVFYRAFDIRKFIGMK